MANIGKLILQDNGGLSGGIRTLSVAVAFHLITNNSKAGDKSPDFLIMAKGPDGGACQIGAVWKEKAQMTGKEYLSIQFTDPAIPVDFERCAAFEDDDGQAWQIIWDRPKAKAEKDKAA